MRSREQDPEDSKLKDRVNHSENVELKKSGIGRESIIEYKRRRIVYKIIAEALDL